ncbi:MAG TPA: TIR domain-containing protein [Longimicrobiales bacterium]|nr:TIR domain-containing protein [Longimicrobiales bacterium]
MRDSIFISYSHKDSDWAERFERMLSTQRDKVRVFRDPNISTGEDWESRLQAEIGRARIALVLVSNDLLGSDYVTGRELPWILKARSDGLIVNWVEIEPSLTPPELQQLQAFKLQSTHRCLNQLHGGDQDEEIKKICERLIGDLDEAARIPRWEFFNRVSEVVHRRFGYAIRREIAVGDHSIVYTADAPGQHLIVKAQVAGLLEEQRPDDLDRFHDELERAKALRHPAFIRLIDWSLETDPRLIVTEFVRARPLRGILRAKNEEGAARLPIDSVRFVLQIIAQALDEYHEAGLVYGNIEPSDVLITKPGEGDWHPRISAYRATQMSLKWEQRAHGFRVTPERLTYLAPEQYEDPKGVTPGTDQYALGLLAIEMLQGHPPVPVGHLADLRTKREFFRNPEAYAGPWSERSADLTAIILRMLSADPSERFGAMSEAAAALGGQATTEGNNRRLAKRSYLRLMDRRDEVLGAFYENLLRERPDLRAKFPESHDWEAQRRVLAAALVRLLNFAGDHGQEVEPTVLSDTAARHRELGLAREDYDHFEQAFLTTLGQFGEGDEELRRAWSECFRAGLGYMKARGSRSQD